MILVWMLVLVRSDTTLGRGQEITVVLQLSGRAFLDIRGRKWKIDVVDLRDNISVQEG